MLKVFIKRYLILFFMVFNINLATSDLSFAKDTYYAQVSAGNNNGESCLNAIAIGNLTWGGGTGSIVAGDIVHICGTISTPITVGVSGTSENNRVTIKFENNSKLSRRTWGSGGSAITISGKNWVVIDGGINGIIESTDCGTNLSYRDSNYGVLVNGDSSNIEIMNLNIHPLYDRVRNDNADFGGYGIAVNGGTIDNVSIHNNVISKAWSLIYIVYGKYKNFSVYNNNLTHGAAGIIIASGGINTSFIGANIYGNTINLYDDASNLACTNLYHNDGIHMWAQQIGSYYENVNIFSNKIGPNMGACTTTTGWVYLEGTYARTNIKVYNNIFLVDNANNAPTNGMIYDKGGIGPIQGASILNNTFSSVSGKGIAINLGSVSNSIIKNNIFNETGHGIYADDGSPTNVTIDYNVFYNVRTLYGYKGSTQVGGADPHALTTNPLLNSLYVPQVGSSAIDTGVDLSANFTDDYKGIRRPQALSWDRGAYEVQLKSPLHPQNINIH